MVNSHAAIERFPFPFNERSAPFRYSVNVEPHEPSAEPGSVTEHYFDIDEFYLSELAERQKALARNTSHLQYSEVLAKPSWELLNHVLKILARDYPNYFSLKQTGPLCEWANKLTQTQTLFKIESVQSLGCSPLQFTGEQLPGDWVLIKPEAEKLICAGGLVTGPAGWSLAHIVGQDFLEWHNSVPDDYRVFPRANQYLQRLKVGHPVRRTNWGLCVHPRLDMSLQEKPHWRSDRENLVAERVGRDLNLRVELQVLERLPESQWLAFYIRTYFLTLEELVSNDKWRGYFLAVLQTLPENIVRYKGLSAIYGKLLAFLSQ